MSETQGSRRATLEGINVRFLNHAPKKMVVSTSTVLNMDPKVLPLFKRTPNSVGCLELMEDLAPL